MQPHNDLRSNSQKDFRLFSVRGFFSCSLWVKSYILYLLLGNVVVKLYFYLGILLHRRSWNKYPGEAKVAKPKTEGCKIKAKNPRNGGKFSRTYCEIIRIYSFNLCNFTS
jgi:hypothetical protein